MSGGPTPLVIIGGGEHARVVLDAARSRPDLWTPAGYADSGPIAETERRGAVPYLGDDAAAAPEALRLGACVVLGFAALGSARKRRELVAYWTAARVPFGIVVHARAWVSPEAVLEPGVVVLAGALVVTGAHVGAHAVLNTAAVIEHDVRIGAFTHVAPGAILGGGAEVGDDCHVGLGARVRDHVRVGQSATIAMGAVVVGPVETGAVVAGVPARPMRRSSP